MQIFKFPEFKHFLWGGGRLVLLLPSSPETIHVAAKVVLIDSKQIVIQVSSEENWSEFVMNKVLSGLLICPEGIFGFHSAINKVDMMNGQLVLAVPDFAWRIERRQFPRVQVNKTILCDRADKKMMSFAPAGHITQALLANVCRNGMCIQTNQKIEVGQYLYVLFSVDAIPAHDNLAAILWRVEQDDSQRYAYSYGLRFLSDQSPVMDMIENFVAEKILLRV